LIYGIAKRRLLQKEKCSAVGFAAVGLFEQAVPAFVPAKVIKFVRISIHNANKDINQTALKWKTVE